MDSHVLMQWAERAGMPDAIGGADVVHGWGDPETAFGVTQDGSGFAVVAENRGRRSTRGRFAALDDADAFLLVCFGVIWRAQRGLDDAFPPDPAPEATVVRASGGYEVRARGRRAWFGLRSDAKRFTSVAGMTLDDVAAFLLT